MLGLDAVMRSDSWKAIFGSFGKRGDRGRGDQTRFEPNPLLDDATLTAAYRDLWLVRRLVEARSDEVLRAGWGVPETEKLPKFTPLNTATHEEGAFQRALHLADLKGGAGIFLGYKNTAAQALTEPAPPGTEVAFLEVFDRFQLQGTQRVRDVDAPDYDRPQIWQVVGPRRAGLRFHTSRMIRFPGAPRGGDLGASEDERDWGHSRLQSVWEDVVRYGVFWQAIAHLMQLSSVGVLKLHGLIELLSSKRRADAEARIDLLNETLSIARMLLLDAKQGEEYHREAVSFTDMPALLQELQLNTAGAFRMPATKLFGRSPAGMNATGESDIRQWYDECQAYGQGTVKPRLEQLLTITEGRAIEVKFKPLWQPTEKELQEIRMLRANTNERLWSMGVWSDAELRKAENAGKLPEQMSYGDTPTAEPTRPVTTVAIVPPGDNPAKPEDPNAPDKPPPAKPASPFPPKR
ncbi:MAG: hypothetical protein RL685_1555 [Pseudomonadota bacterium]|jgi:phage-related protein (TIGR01555 family)